METRSSSKDPVTSYGVLLFYKDEAGVLRYLLAQRRDTIEYSDFLRGRYSHSVLDTYFSLMTLEERDRLSKYPFEELWDDLWVNHDNSFYRDIMPKARSKFNSNKGLITNLLKKTKSTTREPIWGFPKGKKNFNETEIECAFREFKEETRLSIDYLNLLNIPPSREIFKGSNYKMYSTVYYIAQVDERLPIVKTQTSTLRTETVSEEIADLRWCTVNEGVRLLSPWRQKLLMDADEKIQRYFAE